MRHRRAKLQRAYARSRRICNARNRFCQSKGRENEKKVEEALAFLKERGKILFYFVSTPGDQNDHDGIDAGCLTLQGKMILFQIKSSFRGVQKHLRKHPDIPCLNVHECPLVPDIVELIEKQFALARP